jgi:hypothetical protein
LRWWSGLAACGNKADSESAKSMRLTWNL